LNNKGVSLADIIQNTNKDILVTKFKDLAVTPDLVARGYNAGDIVKQVAEVAGGGGGGKATLAQAGGRNKDKLDEALRLVKSLI